MTNKETLTQNRGFGLLASLCFAMTLVPSLATAIPSYSFDLEPGDIQNNFNVPRFTLTNTSTEGEEILSFSITVGDEENFFYDFVADLNSMPFGSAAHVATETTTGAQLLVGDRTNDRSGTSRLDWSFDDFDAGEELIFQADIDPISAQDGGRQSADSRYSFLNNGDADNATISVVFSDGSTATHIFGDHAGELPNSFHYAGLGQFQDPLTGTPLVQGPPNVSAPVPEPGAALLFGFGLLTVARKPRRSESV
ncbi:MAG: PEP-CTERM sorting domain-containing protein [Myxococcota bacterium]